MKVFGAGMRKKLYVDTDRAARSIPPNIVEVLDNAGVVQAKVCGAQICGDGPFVVCWSGMRSGSVWVETHGAVTVLLAEDMPLPQT